MSDHPKAASYEDLLAGRVDTTCLLNEPIDYTVNFTINFVVEKQSAIEIAQRRWRTAELISGEDHER